MWWDAEQSAGSAEVDEQQSLRSEEAEDCHFLPW